MQLRLVLAALVASGAACDRPSPPPRASATEAAPAANKPRDALLVEGEADAVRAAIQGTFAMPWWRGQGEKHPEVWTLAGDTLSRWDGTTTEVGKTVLAAPCLLRVRWPSGSTTYEPFVVDGATIWFGVSGGSTRGDRTVVCASEGVWVLGHGGCRRWSPGGISTNASGLHAEEASCSLAADGTFTAGGRTWVKRGGVLVDDGFEARRQAPPQRFPGPAEAMSALRP